MLQSLESRTLLSAAVDFDTIGGVLSVTGSEKPDRIEVAVSSSPLYSLASGVGTATKRTSWGAEPGNYVNVFSEGRLVYQTFLPGKTLQQINLNGAGSGDTLLACKFESPVVTVVLGEDGSDQIDVANFGGGGETQVFAGSGNDLVRAAGQTKVGFLVWGEDGDDTIYGSAANDTIFGDVDDRLMFGPRGYVGDDVIYGGAGDDYLCGCEGSDQLYGEAGDDFLDGEGGADMLDGGAGEDIAVFDPLDKIINIEVTTK
jgi:Ca2+-binding RTX toxin-like protein